MAGAPREVWFRPVTTKMVAVVVLKAKARGQPEETLRYDGVELRHEPAHHLLVLHKNGTVIGTFDDAIVARWHYEPAGAPRGGDE